MYIHIYIPTRIYLDHAHGSVFWGQLSRTQLCGRVHMRIHINICIYVYVHIRLYTYIYMYKYDIYLQHTQVSVFRDQLCVCIHVHTYIHTHIYIYMYVNIHIYTYIYAYIMFIHIQLEHTQGGVFQGQLSACIHTHIYIRIYIYIHICTHTHTHTHIYIYIYTYIYVYIYIYIYIYICVYTHTHIYLEHAQSGVFWSQRRREFRNVTRLLPHYQTFTKVSSLSNIHYNTTIVLTVEKTDSTQINLNKRSFVNLRSTSNQSRPCTVLQYPSRTNRLLC